MIVSSQSIGSLALIMSNSQILESAIRKLSPVRCVYSGHVREMCPHVLGHKNGKLNVLSYQYGGSSSSGLVISQSYDNWRCMDIDKIEGLELIDGEWQSFSPHSQPQTCVDEVIAKVPIQ